MAAVTGDVALDLENESAPDPIPLSSLREDLDLFKGARTADGSPTWVIHDPVRNKFFQIGWLEFEMIKRWPLAEGNLLAEKMAVETSVDVDTDDVKAMLRFLDTNQLLARKSTYDVKRLGQLHQFGLKHKKSMRMQQLMFIRFPLFKPDRFLEFLLPMVRFFYHRTFWIMLSIVGVASLVMVSRQWSSFTSSFNYIFSAEGLLLFGVAISIAKMFHELGHALTAKYYGLKVPVIGIALMVFWPVFYTDTTESWKLVSRKQRLAIGAAGVIAELALAVIATFLWLFLQDGPLRSVVLFIATFSWLFTLLVNLNPFLRWDGYYVLSDLVGVENMQNRSFALLRWWIREKLWAFGDEVPEEFPRKKRRRLMIYALACWIYRIFLFSTISLVVYTFFFKIIGLFMLFLVLTGFILKPVSKELGVWVKRRGEIRFGVRTFIVIGVIAGMVALLWIPWSSSIRAPAILVPVQKQKVFPPIPSLLKTIHVSNGDVVAQGDAIFSFASPELDYELVQTRLEIQLLQQQISRQSGSDELLERRQVLENQLAEALATYNGVLNQQQRLEYRAPFNGIVQDVQTDLTENQWVTDKFSLASVINPDSFRVVAYLAEADLHRISLESVGEYVSDNSEEPEVPVKVIEIDRANTAVLDEPYSASVYGGRLAVSRSEQGELELQDAVYRVLMNPVALKTEGEQRITKGIAIMEGDASSLIERVWKVITAVFIRESGF